jgi:hypothetical protein
MLIVTSLIAVGWSFISPQQSMLAMCLNFLQPAVSRLFQRRS